MIPTNAVIIYIFGDLDAQFAKLGKTKRAEIRIKQHETRGPSVVEMKPLAMVYGHDSDEKYLKRYWKTIQIRGSEWIQPSEQFRSWLRFMRQQAFVARTFDELDHVSFVDSRYWLPGNGHAFSKKQGQFNFNNDPWSDLDLEEVGDGDFYTNPLIIEAARQALGGRIDLDPASCRLANTIVKADRFYAMQQDGLTQKWDGNIWLNPPFGQWELWAAKIISELNSGRIERACVLLPSRASTAQHCHRLVIKSQALVIPNGRHKFWGPKAGTPDEGHFIFFFGEGVDAFDSAFAHIGQVFVNALTRRKIRESAA